MEIGQQIRKYREKENYSQEYLAEKLYVSRQTISNWENERSYPDIHNLLMMCNLFNVSLDDLVKGDVKRMEHEEIKKDMDFWTWMMLIWTLLACVLIGPLLFYLSWWGVAITYVIFSIGFYSSTRIDKIKYKHGMDNYDRIVAFMNGQDPNEVQTTKTRNFITCILSFIFVVGAFVIICWLSIYLSFKFLP
ncbi:MULTISPECIES: helix-turn-helix transcriptional regulator [Staphylococcus]|uniref:helix-turn-helix transcriptional regulator n=1 Tax=Staphylococcus TaxID=1279 RepID=UPI00069E5099|nr:MULTISPECIES: helix-turn-helix transcriptional regulator [Staphylococcus]NCA39278.1 helix-turn-helix transcriptional regulator [Streptococcus equi]MBW5899419.1 helix-turn-helix domain-containing protein [Staphylococcus haemolyticus]MCD9080110.1 helix-turn-helix domain-containing protein [Staphylococcus haemolyticus]MCH4354784.1 helix-turn-helix domain-containing protein [Staphylococcus haemolyticus]MCH4363415.1 helix-turn-helix domain-containing protein [Staphylococcus haemolyticus]